MSVARRHWERWVLALAFLVLASGCGLWPTREAAPGPTEVVERFYRWVLGYPGNPVADREYRESPYLTESFKQRVDEMVSEPQTGGADPFLLAQDVPERFSLGETTIDGGHATVEVDLYWAGNDVPTPRIAVLERVLGEWLIDRVTVP